MTASSLEQSRKERRRWQSQQHAKQMVIRALWGWLPAPYRLPNRPPQSCRHHYQGLLCWKRLRPSGLALVALLWLEASCFAVQAAAWFARS